MVGPMISQTAEHALRAVLQLAQQADGTLMTADAIAEALQAPRNYLSKTLHALSRQGIVVGVRGPGGGFRLEVPADRLTVARVVEAFDEHAPSTVCLLGGRSCSDRVPCQAHLRWKAVCRRSLEPLQQTTIADLLCGDLPARWAAQPSSEAARSPMAPESLATGKLTHTQPETLT